MNWVEEEGIRPGLRQASMNSRGNMRERRSLETGERCWCRGFIIMEQR